MVFAGRKEYVSILDCYLQRNLVRNGGWLDEVMWIMHGNTTADIVYVNDLTDNVPEYTRHDIYPEAEDAPRPFGEAYKLCQPGTYYVKIDDDVVFMEDNAIQAIVQRKIDNPGNLMVSGNVLNGPALCHIHHEMNTSKPFLPEMQKPADFVEDDRRFLVNWRPSTLPQWKAPEGYSFSLASPAPFNGHRWLPVHGSDGNKVALSEPDHTKNGTDDVTWVTAAQSKFSHNLLKAVTKHALFVAHYSFLDNLEKHELKRYKFEVLEYPKDARTINFVAFDGDDASRHPVQGDDDLWWTKTLPSKLKRPALLDGTAMVVHFGTYSQTYTHGGKPGHGLRETDLLRRYRSYANEFICGKPWGSPML